MRTAAYATELGNDTVRCDLCPHGCMLGDGQRGRCITRGNRDGRLVSMNYCRPVSAGLDPIEKKPLYHFMPGAAIYSLGPNGCNLSCRFCQNSEISQQLLSSPEASPDSLADAVLASGGVGVAYTYAEPYIWFETLMDVGGKVREMGLKNVMVTNGFMKPGPLEDLLTVVDAMNVDIKSMEDDFYRRLCGARVQPVLDACVQMKKRCHLEITNLLVTGENDGANQVRALARFIAENLGADTPLHLSRYFPRYRMSAPPTDGSVLLRAWEIAREQLAYVYVGNAPEIDKANTICPSCRTLLIERSGYAVRTPPALAAGAGTAAARCQVCGHDIPVIF